MNRFELADAALAASTAAKHAAVASEKAQLAEWEASRAVDCSDDDAELVEEYAANACHFATLAAREADFAAKIAKRAEKLLFALYIEKALEEDEND